MKIERDKNTLKTIMNIAIEVFNDESVPLVDRVTRVRAAITLCKDDMDVSELKKLLGEQ